VVSVSAAFVDEHGHASGRGHQLAQEFQPLCPQLDTEKIDACRIAARPGKAGDKTRPDRVFGNGEDDWYRCGFRQCRDRTSGRDDHGDVSANQFRRQRRQSIELIFGPSVFDSHVLALDKADLF